MNAQTPTEQGWSSSEMAALAVTMVTNLAAAAGVVLSIPEDQIGHFNAAIAKSITAGMALAANALVVWKWLQGRTAVKTETIRAGAVTQAAESVANANVAAAQITAQASVNQAAAVQAVQAVQGNTPQPTP